MASRISAWAISIARIRPLHRPLSRPARQPEFGHTGPGRWRKARHQLGHLHLVQDGEFVGQGRGDPFDIVGQHQLAVRKNAEVQLATGSQDGDVEALAVGPV